MEKTTRNTAIMILGLKILIIVKVVALMSISGCVEAPQRNNFTNDSSPTIHDSTNVSSDIFFPTRKEPTNVHMLALLKGKLINDNGCLRVKGYLIVWPYGYSFTINKENGSIQIFDEEGRYVAYVGMEGEFGGGGMEGMSSDEAISLYSTHLPNERCPGPYWIAAPLEPIR